MDDVKGFYAERDALSGDKGGPYDAAANFDRWMVSYTGGEVDAAKFSFEDFAGPVDQSTVSGDSGPLGGSTDAVNPLA